MEPIKFLLNESEKTKNQHVVDAPAFSLTKVMAVVAPLLTALVTVATNWIKKNDFTAGQITIIIVALIAFLAVTGAADVLARGIAASAKMTSDAATRTAELTSESTKAAAAMRLRLTPFESAIKGQLHQEGRDKDVTVVAVSDGTPAEFLCHDDDGALTWNPVDKVTLKG